MQSQRVSKAANYDIIKPLQYDDMKNGSDGSSEKGKGQNLTQYDKEQLQHKIDQMKREINEYNR